MISILGTLLILSKLMLMDFQKRNTEIRNEIKDIVGKNIFITKKNDFIKLNERNDIKYFL